MLYSLELASMTAVGEKLQLATPSIKIVGYYYDVDSRHPLMMYIIMILEWPIPNNLYKLHSFISVCIYY